MIYKKKLKILFNGEASFANTGYGIISREFLTRLHASNKYRIAELGSFAEVGDPRDHCIKWKYYPNQVNERDPRHQHYCSDEANKTNRWRFDKVLLDFKPDIVIDIRDTTMFSWINLSPLRKYFYLITSPSVDSAPQIDDWVSSALQSDRIVGYTDYALDVLNRECGGKANLFKTAWPSVNTKTFFPIQNKTALRQALGIDPNANIIGFCARNQLRKLIPSLMLGFKQFLERVKIENPNSYNSYYLYLNTTHPDLMQWDLSKLLVEYGLSNRVLFTYFCTKCTKWFPNKFQDMITSCRYCNSTACALLPRVNCMISSEQLNEVYNLFDVYVQYVNCEGLGMPLIEAAGAGIPVMGIDYSGVGDALKRLGGIPLKYHCLLRDIRVNADRAVPDNGHLVEELLKFFKRPRQINLRNGFKMHETCKKKFDWNEYTKVWMEAIDTANLTGLHGKWHSTQSFQPFPVNENQNISDYMNDLLDIQLQESRLKHTTIIDNYIKNAENGMVSTGNGVAMIDKNQIKNLVNNLTTAKVQTEQVRVGQAMLQNEDFFQYAEAKELVNL